MKRFYEFLGEHAMKIIYFKKSSMNHMKMQISAIFVKKNLEKVFLKDKTYH